MKGNEIFLFRYSKSRKLFSIFLLFAIICFLAMGFFSEGPLWAGGVAVLIVCLMFDFYFKKIFCSIEITDHNLTFKPGGGFGRFFFKKKEFFWDKYNFIVYYFNYKDEICYSSLKIYNKNGRNCFSLKERNFSNFPKLVDALKKINQNTKLSSIETEIINNGIKGAFFK